LQPQQQIISLLSANQGVISRTDLNGNGKFLDIVNTYMSDPDTAVRLINLQSYYNKLSDNEKIILYNKLQQFALCGKYRGLSTARDKKDFIMIEMPDDSMIEVNYDDIIDPVVNNYSSNLQGKLQKCIDLFNASEKNTTSSSTSETIVNTEPEENTTSSSSSETIVNNDVIETDPIESKPSGGKNKTIKKYYKKTTKTIKKQKNKTKKHKTKKHKTKKHRKKHRKTHRN
jgi:hypothetical protein